MVDRRALPEPDGPEGFSGAVLFLAVYDLYRPLLDQHVADRYGRCAACDSDAWAAPWPCLIHQLAQDAAALAQRWIDTEFPEQQGGPDGRAARTTGGADRGAQPLVEAQPESSGDQGGPGGGGRTDQ